MSVDKKKTFTAKQLREHDLIVTGKAMILCLGVLMDEYDLEAEDINRLLEQIDRYAEATKDIAHHKLNGDASRQVITIEVIANIIKEKTGIDVGWTKFKNAKE